MNRLLINLKASQSGRTRMMNLLVLLCAFFLNVQGVSAQSVVQGHVKDANNEPLIGVSVSIVGKNNAGGAVTNVDGNYSISVPDKGCVLKFSYVGYKTKLVNVKAGVKKMDVTLLEEENLLAETVVTAMNLRRSEKSMSTAYQKVNMDGMDENRSGNFLDGLSGKLSGVQIISNGTGGSASVVIRGMNSITGNNQPLFVIDGTPMVNDVNTGESSIDYGNPAANLNPDDIESMVVLKGANASALYGSDAANGAIIITTKKAKAKAGLGVTFSSTLQFSKILQKPAYQNVYGGGESGLGIRKETFNYYDNTENPYNPNLEYGIARLGAQNQRSWGFPMLGYRVYGRNGEYKTYSPSNSLLDLYKTSHSWTNNVAIEKASDVLSFRLSYTHTGSNDVMEKQNEFERNNFNFRGTAKPTKWMEIELNTRYAHENMNNRNWRGSNKQNPMYDAAWMPRDMSYAEMTPWKNADGTLCGYNKGGFVNPMWAINELSNNDKRDTFWGDLTLNFQIFKDLRLRLKGTVDKANVSGYEFVNKYDPMLSNGDGKYKEFQESSRNLTYEAMLIYNKHWKDFNLSASLGANTQRFKFTKLNSQIETLLMPDVKSLANNGAKMESWQDYSAKQKQAIYGTVSTGYKDFIYLDLTARNDWSSTLPASNRSYFYYSIGSSFILTEAVKSIPKSVLSFAKLRASYARVGNDTGFDQLFDGLSYGNVLNGNMTWYQSDSRKMNPYLKPERTTSYELGADLRFLNNRLGVDFTYYSKTTRDEILSSQVSTTTGYTNAVFNAGKVKNWGFEVTINATPLKIGHFTWDTQLNWSKNDSKVLKLADGVERMQLAQSEGTVQFYIVEGRSMGTLYAKMAKLTDDGKFIVDREGKPRYQEDQFLCDVSPKWFGGWRNSFKYKNFSASVLIDFKHGGKLWSATQHQGTRDGQTPESLNGRDAYLFSNTVLGESDFERQGFLDTKYTTNPDATNSMSSETGVLIPYEDSDRPKGILAPGVYEDALLQRAGQANQSWTNPASYYMNTDANARLFLYDASYIKLREVSISYDVPRSFLAKLGNFFTSARLSLVGRNLAILHQNTPKGIDPEASSSLGVVQGFEKGFSLPQSTYGFDIKVTF